MVPLVAVEFRWLLYLALIPVAQPWDPWESENPPCQFAMCGLQRNLHAPLFFSTYIYFFFALFYDAGFPEHSAGPLQLLQSKQQRCRFSSDGEGTVSVFKIMFFLRETHYVAQLDWYYSLNPFLHPGGKKTSKCRQRRGKPWNVIG